MNVQKLTDFNQEQVGLLIPDNIQKECWQVTRNNSPNISRWQSYLNLVTMKTILPWLRDIFEQNQTIIKVKNEADLLEIWEFVNGFAISIGAVNLVFIPSESEDLGEICVPQEWVDIPSLAADFYVAIQINSDESWLRIWGYSSYEYLKNEAEYDPFSRSYTLGEEQLDHDIIFMLVTAEYTEQHNHFIPELGFLSQQKAQELLTKLKSFKDYAPRLIIPFQQWGLIFVNDQWRKQLFEARKPINLTAWINYNFQQAMLTGWQTLESLELSLGIGTNGTNGTNGLNGFAMRSRAVNIDTIYHCENETCRKQAIESVAKINRNTAEASRAIAALTHVLRSCEDDDTRWSAELSLRNLDPHNAALAIWRGKIIDLGIDLAKHKVALVIGTLPKSTTKTSIFVKVYSREADLLPENLILTIIDENFNEFNKIISRNFDNSLQYKFWGQPGEQFSIKLSLGDAQITETFVI
jgi:Protein of unknown function (DUF1822)